MAIIVQFFVLFLDVSNEILFRSVLVASIGFLDTPVMICIGVLIYIFNDDIIELIGNIRLLCKFFPYR